MLFFLKKRSLMTPAFSVLYSNLIKIAGGTIEPLSPVASRLIFGKSLFGFKIYFVVFFGLILIVDSF